MSKLNQFREVERKIAEQLQILEDLKNDKGLQKDIEFENMLKELLTEYGMSNQSAIAILDPNYYASQGSGNQEKQVTRAKKPRAVKVFVHPETGEKIETRGGNHRLLRSWKDQYGDETVMGWQVQ